MTTPTGIAPLRAAVVNATEMIGHHGCSLVARQLHLFAGGAGITVTRRLPLSIDPTCLDTGDIDLVIVNGEGSLHHDRKPAMAIAAIGAFCASRGKPAYLINSVYQANGPEIAAGVAQFRGRYVRESLSRAAMSEVGIEASVVPDLSLTLVPDPAILAGPRGTHILVNDSVNRERTKDLYRLAQTLGVPFVSIMAKPPLMADFPGRNLSRIAQYHWRRVVAGFRTGAERARIFSQLPDLDSFLRYLVGEAGLVVTGRFHTFCIALDLGIPVLGLRSNTHKIEGLCADIGIASRVVDDFDALRQGLAASGADYRPYTQDEREKIELFRSAARSAATAMFADIVADALPSTT